MNLLYELFGAGYNNTNIVYHGSTEKSRIWLNFQTLDEEYNNVFEWIKREFAAIGKNRNCILQEYIDILPIEQENPALPFWQSRIFVYISSFR